MRTRLLVVMVALAVGALGAACGTRAAGSQTRTVLVDFSHDEFASFFIEYFPRKVTVRPGDTVVFRQTWTGEPHSVTMGKVVDDSMRSLLPLLERVRAEGFPDDGTPEAEELDQEFEELWNMELPWMFDGPFEAAQNASQPCYLSEGLPPEDPDEPCPPDAQEQPEFDGTHSYYNSGFIPYEGPSGNTFTLPLSDDLEPGTYFFYCNLHGPLQSGELEVVEPGASIPSQDQVNREARELIEELAAPLRKAFREASAGRLELPEEVRGDLLSPGQRYFEGNLAGLFSFEEEVHGGINEFIPETISTRVGEPVTWTMLGLHTISFDVPTYFPIIEREDDGTVRVNPRIGPPAGGSPEVPQDWPPGEGEGPPEPLDIDAGSWNGSGFFSSGLIVGNPYLQYTLRFETPGSYRYACLIHPPMVGTVEVAPP